DGRERAGNHGEPGWVDVANSVRAALHGGSSAEPAVAPLLYVNERAHASAALRAVAVAHGQWPDGPMGADWRLARYVHLGIFPMAPRRRGATLSRQNSGQPTRGTSPANSRGFAHEQANSRSGMGPIQTEVRRLPAPSQRNSTGALRESPGSGHAHARRT